MKPAAFSGTSNGEGITNVIWPAKRFAALISSRTDHVSNCCSLCSVAATIATSLLIFALPQDHGFLSVVRQPAGVRSIKAGVQNMVSKLMLCKPSRNNFVEGRYEKLYDSSKE